MYQEAEDLVILVEDNGNGCASDQLEAYKWTAPVHGAEQGGIGLYNVHRRLQLHYGSHYGVEVENRVPHGFKATLRHPILESND
ncbi:hypothetical protein D3C85_1266080 [compost metagenome]